MAEIQQSVTKDLRGLYKKAQEQGFTAGDDPDAKSLQVAFQTAIKKSEEALKDLNNKAVLEVRFSQREADDSLAGVVAELKNHDWAAKIGLLTIVTIILWQTCTPKSFRFLPAPLIAVVVATVLSAGFYLPVVYVEVPDRLLSEVHLPSWTIFKDVPLSVLIESGLVIAAVASAETLLCATAVDQMHSGKRTQYDKELMAQGFGNTICGVLGALPMTGVIVRSAANVEAGAKTQLSTILHGIWLLLFVVFLGFVLRLIPTAALAGILVYTGYKLINPKTIFELRRFGWSEVAIYVITVVCIVVEDLLFGVIVGILLSGGKLLYVFSHLDTELHTDPETEKTTLHLRGSATFVRLPLLANDLDRVPRGSELHVDLSELHYIDHACLELLMNWAAQHESTGGSLVIDWEELHAKFRTDGSRMQRVASSIPDPPASQSDAKSDLEKAVESDGDGKDAQA
ncbi:SulP family inorganic anion transporter [Kolteria novifilia]|uniref:SulP family inorganic anion transporter n=1 Tax=Kolteria novifilia TaxID=2527975 RepID=UPI003AF33965